jgi:hypothetical protein
VIPAVYRTLLRDRRTRRLLAGLGVSSLGDGMSTVTIAWLAVRVAPAGEFGAYVGLALAPFIPLTYALFQSATTTANLPSVLAARSALVMVSTPLGTAIGGPLVGALAASETLAASGIVTVALAIAASFVWTGDRDLDRSAAGRGSLDRQRAP